MRSFPACSFLSSLGFKELYNMLGGMSAYRRKQEGAGVKGN
jgi:rhodanese-related sulfurtransferase